jgi:hypothetical protein
MHNMYIVAKEHSSGDRRPVTATCRLSRPQRLSDLSIEYIAFTPHWMEPATVSLIIDDEPVEFTIPYLIEKAVYSKMAAKLKSPSPCRFYRSGTKWLFKLNKGHKVQFGRVLRDLLYLPAEATATSSDRIIHIEYNDQYTNLEQNVYTVRCDQVRPAFTHNGAQTNALECVLVPGHQPAQTLEFHTAQPVRGLLDESLLSHLTFRLYKLNGEEVQSERIDFIVIAKCRKSDDTVNSR